MVRYGTEIESPRPMVDPDSIEFWKKLQETKQLHIQRCKDCETYMHPPRPVCHKCQTFNTEFVPVSGKGTIYSYVVYHRSTYPSFKVPYEVVLVELEEGVRIVSNMKDCEPHEIYIGMPVEAVVDQVFEDIALPKFIKRDPE